MAEEEFDESTELLDQIDMAIVLFKDSLNALRNTKQPTSGPIDEFNGLLDQMDMAVGLFTESVGKIRKTTAPGPLTVTTPKGPDFARFNDTERSRRVHTQRTNRSSTSKEAGVFMRGEDIPVERR